MGGHRRRHIRQVLPPSRRGNPHFGGGGGSSPKSVQTKRRPAGRLFCDVPQNDPSGALETETRRRAASGRSRVRVLAPPCSLSFGAPFYSRRARQMRHRPNGLGGALGKEAAAPPWLGGLLRYQITAALNCYQLFHAGPRTMSAREPGKAGSPAHAGVLF